MVKTDTKLKKLSLHKQTLRVLSGLEVPAAQAGEQAYTQVVCHSYIGC
jgi:hypothetical protein